MLTDGCDISVDCILREVKKARALDGRDGGGRMYRRRLLDAQGMVEAYKAGSGWFTWEHPVAAEGV